MTIVSSPNAISIEDVYNEFGPSAIAGSTLASAPYGLDEFYSLGNKTSYFTGRTVTSTPNDGEISLNNFYGKSRDLQFDVIGTRNNAANGYPTSFTFPSLGFTPGPGGSLNRWYIVFLTRPYGTGQPGVTLSFDGAAAVSPTRTASSTWSTTTTVKGVPTTTTGNMNARVSIWLHKKNTGSSLTIGTNNTTQYQMSVFEVYTTHDMTSANRTFYSGSSTTVSFSVSAAAGGLFIQSATNEENSNVILGGSWATSTFGTSGNAFRDDPLLRPGSFSRRGVRASTAATFFTTAGTRTFTMTDERGRTLTDQQVSGGIYIAP
jgi:hypothetical protein